MKTLKEFFNENKKELSYNFYRKILKKPQPYTKITRSQIYEEIMDAFYDDPEIVLRMCNVEQIILLQKLVTENFSKDKVGYIEGILLNDLTGNYLVFENELEYYIPKDLVNTIKMALNLYNESEYSMKDVVDSVILGLMRIYNVALLTDFIEYLQKYSIIYDIKGLKEYLKSDFKDKDKLAIKKYQKKEYIILLEYDYYQDIINLTEECEPTFYSLEEVISIGKYKINLFQEPIFNFLNFLEAHLTYKYVELIIHDLVLYAGFGLENEGILMQMADNILTLYNEMLKVIPYLPCWVYKGNTKQGLKIDK